MSTRVRWLGHACVQVESDGQTVLIDPFLTDNPAAATTADKVAEDIAAQGIGVRLVSMHTVKPIDRDAVTRAATETRYVFTLEEHSVEGGLGGAVAEVMAEMDPGHAPLKRIGLRPEFNTTVGDQNYLKSLHGLDQESVLKTIQQIIARSYGRVG